MTPGNFKKSHIAKSTILSKGKTTIPAAIRSLAGAIPGAKLEWTLLSAGRLLVTVKNCTHATVKPSLRQTKS